MKIISHATAAGSRPEFECISKDPSIDGVYRIMRLGNAARRAHFRKSRVGDAREASPLSMIKGLVQAAFIAPPSPRPMPQARPHRSCPPAGAPHTASLQSPRGAGTPS